MEDKSLHAEFMRVMHRLRQVKTAGAFGRLHRGEFMALEALFHFSQARPEADGMYVSSLADDLHVSAPAVSRMLRTLEEKGLVKRSVDKEDRRNTYIRLTDEGRRLHEEGHRNMRRFTERVFEEMGEENIRALLTLVQKLGDVMEKISNEDEGEHGC